MNASGSMRGIKIALATACLIAMAFGAATSSALAAEADEAKTAGSTPSRQVDINKATAVELTAIPGVGNALAARIVEFRDKQGPFRRVEDLLKIKGIGEKSLQKMRPHVKVADSD
jgi:competence protein ComEA